MAFEPEPTLGVHGERAAARSPVPIRVLAGVADQIPLSDSTIDAVVTSLVLCSVPDQERALAEALRILRPGGQLRFYEHVVPKRALFQALDRSLWPALAGGCHPARDTAAAIVAAGFEIEAQDGFGFAGSRFEPKVPHILGIARRPVGQVFARND